MGQDTIQQPSLHYLQKGVKQHNSYGIIQHTFTKHKAVQQWIQIQLWVPKIESVATGSTAEINAPNNSASRGDDVSIEIQPS